MKTKMEDRILTIFLEGRIDTNNAGEAEREIFEAVGNRDGAVEHVMLDAGALKYISSAGLRVLMKLRKELKEPLRISGVSRDVYEIFETTGFTELFDIRKALREISVEGCEVLGAGAFGKVYRMDSETIAKIYAPNIPLEFVDKERANSKEAFLFGVPTAIAFDTVKCGDSYGVVYELVEAKMLADFIDRDPSCIPEMVGRAASVLKEIHAVEVPEETNFTDRKAYFKKWLSQNFTGLLEQEEIYEIMAMLDAIPDRRTFLHGDYNAKNIMIQNGELILIDIGEGAYGHPVFDIAMLMLAYIYVTNNPHLDEQTKRQLLGFDPALSGQVWGVMCGGYFGISDPQEIGRITQMLLPLMNLYAVYQGFATGRLPKEIMVQMMRGLVLPSLEQGFVFDGSLFV